METKIMSWCFHSTNEEDVEVVKEKEEVFELEKEVVEGGTSEVIEGKEENEKVENHVEETKVE
jgi:hypothetical protein